MKHLNAYVESHRHTQTLSGAHPTQWFQSNDCYLISNAAILYKEALDELEAPESAVIISGDHNDEKRSGNIQTVQSRKNRLKTLRNHWAWRGQSTCPSYCKGYAVNGFDAPDCSGNVP